MSHMNYLTLCSAKTWGHTWQFHNGKTAGSGIHLSNYPRPSQSLCGADNVSTIWSACGQREFQKKELRMNKYTHNYTHNFNCVFVYTSYKGKGKGTTLQARCGPEGG
jgi:hypothetical protein